MKSYLCGQRVVCLPGLIASAAGVGFGRGLYRLRRMFESALLSSTPDEFLKAPSHRPLLTEFSKAPSYRPLLTDYSKALLSRPLIVHL